MQRTLILLFACLITQVNAQPAAEPPRGPNMERLAAQLELTAEQIPEVEAILTSQGKKSRSLFEQARSQGGGAGVRDELVKLRDETSAMLGKILSEEQLSAYEKLAADRRARMRAQRGR